MTENSEGSSVGNRLSRRGFLKLSGATAAGLVTEELKNQITRPLKAINSLQKEEVGSNKERVTIETSDAMYLPFYEVRHDRPPKAEEIVKEHLDVFFIENANPSWHVVDYPKPSDMLRAPTLMGTTPLNTLITGSSFESTGRPFIDPEVIEDFYNKSTLVAIEGMATTPSLYSRGQLLSFVENTAGIVLTAGNIMYDLEKLRANKKLSKKEIIASTASFVTALWGTTPLAIGSLQHDVPKLFENDITFRNSSARTVNRMENIVNHFHPENANTFLRNIIMARRLDTVAKNITGLKQMQGKPQIGINIHARHGGVEDLLIIQDKLGSRAVLKLLDLYSNKTLKAVVKENGRHEDTLEQNIKTTSTGLVFSVKDAVQGETKHLLVDTELENYLLGRLGE